MRIRYKRHSRIISIEGTYVDRLRLLSTIEYKHYVFSAAFNEYLAVGGRGGKVCIYDIKSLRRPEKVYEIDAHEGSVMDLLRIDEKLFSCSKDATIKIRNGTSLEKILRGHRDCVRSIAYLDGSLVSVSMDGRVLLRDIERSSYKELARYDKRVVHVRSLGDMFATISIDGKLALRDGEKKVFERNLNTPSYGVALNDRYIAVSSYIGVHLFDYSGDEVSNILAPASDYKIRRLSRMGRSIALGGDYILIIDDPDGDPNYRYINAHRDRVYNVVYNKLLFSCSLDGTLKIFSPEEVSKRIEYKTEDVEEEISCSGSDRAPDRLVDLYKISPKAAIDIACGRCIEDLMRRVENS